MGWFPTSLHRLDFGDGQTAPSFLFQYSKTDECLPRTYPTCRCFAGTSRTPRSRTRRPSFRGQGPSGRFLVRLPHAYTHAPVTTFVNRH
eukprot:5153595-Pyramimonas_sp.AAC.1